MYNNVGVHLFWDGIISVIFMDLRKLFKKRIFTGLLAVLLSIVLIGSRVTVYASEADSASVSTETEETVVIEEEDVPLAVSANSPGAMTWWWILIVLAISGVGAEALRRHNEKCARRDGTYDDYWG